MSCQHIPLFPTLVSAFDLRHTITEEMLSIFQKNNNANTHALLENGVSSYGGIARSLTHMPEFQNLFLEIQQCIDSYTNEAGIEPCIISESWFNILKEGGEVRPHRHEGSVVSGAFYPYLENGSANLIFESPLKIVKMNDILAKETEYSSYTVEFPIKLGVLVIFPSWLTHFVEPNKSKIRITLSFNTLRLKDKKFFEKERQNV
jgi:uncharacterized protein (TIGR02466 family)